MPWLPGVSDRDAKIAKYNRPPRRAGSAAKAGSHSSARFRSAKNCAAPPPEFGASTEKPLNINRPYGTRAKLLLRLRFPALRLRSCSVPG